MANSNNKQTRGIISKALGVAKMLSSSGADIANYVAPGSISKLTSSTEPSRIIEVKQNENNMSESNKFENPQQLMRNHVPKVTQQLFGRHYSKINNVASFIAPDINNKISDYFFEKLNTFVSDLSSVDHVLKEVGAQSLDELKGDVGRSNRISQALANQNKIIAAIQGAVSGATGVIGTAVDIPFSLALTLRSIYQEGRAHGYELSQQHEQNVVEYVFRQLDLASIAEKQTLLMAIRTLSNVLETQNTQQLQSLLGSSNDGELLKKWLSQEDGSFKWNWLNHIPQISILSKLAPLAGAGVGAVYSWKLIDEAHLKAREIFSSAQQYQLQHPDEKINVLDAYEKSVSLTSQASPLLLKQNNLDEAKELDKPLLDAEHSVVVDEAALSNDAISQIKIELKDSEAESNQTSVSEGIEQLAKTHVEKQDLKEEKVAEVKPKTVRKKPAVSKKVDATTSNTKTRTSKAKASLESKNEQSDSEK